jgi:ABC-type transporter Mla MlaB component
MTMAIVSTFQKLDAIHVMESLQGVRERLDTVEGETILDFSSIQRIDSQALSVMEELAGLADAKAKTIALRGVNVQIYKVLKLVKLAPRFQFLD